MAQKVLRVRVQKSVVVVMIKNIIIKSQQGSSSSRDNKSAPVSIVQGDLGRIGAEKFRKIELVKPPRIIRSKEVEAAAL